MLPVFILQSKVLFRTGCAYPLNAIRNYQIKPPSRPDMLYGRDDLVAELTNYVVNDEHLALIGPGGMGKSSLVKAIINEPLVKDKFADRRFFVPYEGLDPSTITFETFMTAFARALGIEIAGSDPVRQICTFLDSTNTLIVLDNAETFEEASASSTLRDIPPAIAEIASIPGVILILTSRSRRNALNVRWITKVIPPLDSSSAQKMFFEIYQHTSCSEAEEDIKGLLKELDFHPLSINILANAAQQNGWSPTMLLKRWNDRHSKVLDGGKGKLQSLSGTMQLSLNSLSVQDLGEDGLRALAIIAFLPQGLNESLASDLLPSLSQIDTICDVLCMQSLVYRQDNFLKMLAPIRHYVRDSLSAPDSTCLQEIRAFYCRTIASCSKERDQYASIIISDHLNIEHVVAFNLGCIRDDADETYIACWQFLLCLVRHLPRPTTLTPAISNIVENSSTWMLKAFCFIALAKLYDTLSQLVEASQAYQAAEALYLTAGDQESMGSCIIDRADMLRCQGRFIQSQNLLEDLQHSDSWESLSETTKTQAWCCLDIARMHTFTASADELFVKSMEDRIWGLNSKIWHWRAKFHHGWDTVQVHTHLEDLFLQSTSTGDDFDRSDALRGLAEIAFCEGRLSDATDNLQTIVGIFEGQHSDDALRQIVRKAIVMSKQGNCDHARELIQKASETFPFFALRNARIFLHRSYGSACIELAAGEYDRAEIYFATTIEACDMQSNLTFKALSTRGLGEVAFMHGNFALATERFAETRSLCAEMGVPPQHLYSCYPFETLPDKFKGWSLFLEGLSPFSNDTT
jgi:tetratricopeptide (TPR) repeat protein